MPMLIYDEEIASKIRATRSKLGHDHHDEVWDGVWVVMPPTDNTRQGIVGDLTAICHHIFRFSGADWIYAGVNVSDRKDDWLFNVRCPDMAVFRQGNPAIECGTHYCGGPDFLVEVRGSVEPCREKLPFYASVQTREVLIIDRDPWKLELYQLKIGELREVGRSTLQTPDTLVSSTLPLTFKLVSGQARPEIEVVHSATGETWQI